MKKFIETLNDKRDKDIEVISKLIINTIKAKSLYSAGGWSSVNNKLNESEYFNPNFGISATAICMKLRELKYDFNISVQSSMYEVKTYINSKLGINAIEYRIDRKNHFFIIKL